MKITNLKEIKQINKIIHEPTRLGILKILSLGYDADFIFLKKELEISDGNLASHLKALENAGYLSCKKQFIARKPHSTYSITPQGQQSFSEYLSLMRLILEV